MDEEQLNYGREFLDATRYLYLSVQIEKINQIIPI
jgi:hypothetical protein